MLWWTGLVHRSHVSLMRTLVELNSIVLVVLKNKPHAAFERNLGRGLSVHQVGQSRCQSRPRHGLTVKTETKYFHSACTDAYKHCITKHSLNIHPYLFL